MQQIGQEHDLHGDRSRTWTANGDEDAAKQGTVTFSKAVGDNGSFLAPGATCTLNAAVVTGDTNTCTVQYTCISSTVWTLCRLSTTAAPFISRARPIPNAPLFVVFYDPN